jgi:hypothetical protein
MYCYIIFLGMFIGGQCIEANTSTSCEISMNKNLCLSITSPNL